MSSNDDVFDLVILAELIGNRESNADGISCRGECSAGHNMCRDSQRPVRRDRILMAMVWTVHFGQKRISLNNNSLGTNKPEPNDLNRAVCCVCCLYVNR